MHRITSSAVAAAAIALTASVASATLVVDFHSTSYVSTGVPLARLAENTGTSIPLSMSVPLSPATIGTPAGKNSTFYGGLTLSGPGNRILFTGQFDTTIRDSNTDGDFIQTRWSGGTGFTGAANTTATVIIFAASDFLNGGSAGVKLDNTSTFYIAAGVNNNGENPRQKFVVRQGSSWYIGRSTIVANQDAWTPMQPTPEAFPFSEFEWRNYDPFANILMTDAMFDAAATYSGAFDNINAFGAYVQAERTADSGSGTNADLRTGLRALQLDATLVPEPTMLSLVGGALVLVLRRQRV